MFWNLRAAFPNAGSKPLTGSGACLEQWFSALGAHKPRAGRDVFKTQGVVRICLSSNTGQTEELEWCWKGDQEGKEPWKGQREGTVLWVG